MSSFTQISRLCNYVIGSYKTVFHTRTIWINNVPECSYSRKSAEARLGIEKPKRPMTPFFKFMNQMRPALLARNPGITSKEAILSISKHWQELDNETKAQMLKEFEKDQEKYRKIKEKYEASLTEQQKEDIKRVKEEMTIAKEKRKLKAELKEMGKPKKPMSSYFLFSQSKRDLFQNSQNLKEYQEKIKAIWIKLPESERVIYEKQAEELMDKYLKDLEAWELKMISIGRSDLVRNKRRQKKYKDVQNINKPTEDIFDTSKQEAITKKDAKLSIKAINPLESIQRQSTGDIKTEHIQTKPKESKSIIDSIKSFLKF